MWKRSFKKVEIPKTNEAIEVPKKILMNMN